MNTSRSVTSPDEVRVPVLGHYIDGKSVAGRNEVTADIFDPARGIITSRVSIASQEVVRTAICAARDAFPNWAATPPVQRARVLFRFKELLEKNTSELASVITSEHGKTLSDARGEVTRGIEVVEFACGIPHLLKGEFSENVGAGIDSWSLHQPLGVCVGITPFNFPVMVPLWMFPIAIACGNTFVLKPSEKDPSCSLRLAELASEAGLPPGVFNVVNGDRSTVDALLTEELVQAVSFVGSTSVAQHVYQGAAACGKRVQALGGAKNHLVVMPDAHSSAAAQALLGAAFGSAGERCMAISVALAVGDAADRLIEELKALIEALRIGPGSMPDVDIGPLITREHLERVRAYVDLGVHEGAKLIVDGRTYQPEDSSGFFMGPTLFDRVEPNMRIYREEIFGPVLVVMRVATLERALELINGHEYGNGASIYTTSGEAARRFCHGAQAGMIGVNVPIPVPMAFHSFGGWKRSLFGDLHMHGVEGVRFYSRLKTVTARWSSGGRSAPEFVMPTMK
jgi:malonate-semialdehyde dehydrogenase (acetylating) / methylmalonate-semialdehyde dehydrogenase